MDTPLLQLVLKIDERCSRQQLSGLVIVMMKSAEPWHCENPGASFGPVRRDW